MFVRIVGAVGVGSAVGILMIGATVARRYDKPGSAWFTGYTTLVGVGLGAVSVGVSTGLVPVTDFQGLVGRYLALVWILPAGLWAVFALRYTGRFVSLTLETSILIGLHSSFLFYSSCSLMRRTCRWRSSGYSESLPVITH